MLTEREKLWLMLAEDAEDEAHVRAKELATRQAELAQARKHHSDMVALLDFYHQEDRLKLGQPIGGVWEIQNRKRFLQTVETTVSSLHQQVILAELRETNSRDLLYESLKKQKGFEKLAEKIKEGAIIKTSKQEQKQQDEFSARKYFDQLKDSKS